MSNEDSATLPVPSTYEEAKALLKSLAPPLEAPEPPFPNPAAAPPPSGRALAWLATAFQKAPDKIDPVQEMREAPESPRSLPHLSEQTLLSVLETAPDAMVVIDARGVIVLVNAQMERMFGYQRAELLGERVEILVPIHF